MALKIYFDGGCRPNPGTMETAVVVRGITHHDCDVGLGDNNEAEWRALLHAVRIARTLDARDVILLGDSLVVVNQATGIWTCRSERLRQSLTDFRLLATGFDRLRIRHVRRSQNLAGIALERIHGRL